MKALFQKWLLVFVAIALCVTLSVSWWIHSTLAKESALQLLHANMADAQSELERTEKNLQIITALANTAALAKTRAFARIVQENPTLLNDEQKLERIRQDLDVEQLHVSNEKGIQIVSVPTACGGKGFDLASTEQSRAFMPALTDPTFELVQDPQRNGQFNIPCQYAGIARRDKPGVIQIAYKPERLETALALADPRTIAEAIRIGHNGKLTIEPYQKGALVQQESVFYKVVDGEKCLCLSLVCDQYLLTASLPVTEIYQSRNAVIRILIVGNLVLFAVIFFLVSNLLQRVVITGISTINQSLEKITNGNLNEQVSVKSTVEFTALSNGINTMVAALEKAFQNETKRLNAELEIGRTIQASVLPVDFPCNEFYSLFALMHTAKKVGGDFYDFFKIDPTHQAMLIADVAGKGLTAALYMMNAKTLLKKLIQSHTSPAEALSKANQELCNNNPAHMFLTLFLAILNTETGELVCVNAGHNPPLIKHANADWEYLTIKHSIALGCTRKARYQAVPVQLAQGDRLLIYTDGITEAMTRDRQRYGTQRLQTFLNQSTAVGAELLTKLCNNLSTFVQGAEQSDDITAMTFDFHATTSTTPLTTTL